MFSVDTKPSALFEVFRFFDLLYHSIVKEVRKNHSNPIVGLINDIAQAALFVVFFIFFMQVMGMMRHSTIRGNEILYVITGVFPFLVHTKAVGATTQAGGPLNPMNLHTHVTSLLNILAATIATLYVQVLAMGIILFASHVVFQPIEVARPQGVFYGLAVAWICGIAVGNFFNSLRIFFPKSVGLISKVYQRISMVFSGKFYLGNLVPVALFPLFAWNPLFHCIDYVRSATFVNYTAHRTSFSYAIWFTLCILLVSFMLDHWSRKYASSSWSARQ